MTSRTSVLSAAVLAALALSVAGCGTGETSGAPTTSAVPDAWDPCTLSDEALVRATLDPATEGPGLNSRKAGESSCGWENDDIGLIITASSTGSTERFHNSPDNVDFRDLEVAGRHVVVFRQASDEPGTFCHMAVPFDSGGLALMQVGRSALTKDTTPMCDWALKVGDALVAEMPA
ncbi:DUF3558 domain-containing protein [Rhodococcus rhodnii]|uniref:DUF3558 domain-containing protein n=2 Tax=Rhodococcus rhodnii TaxID=38312 RepID=R7WSH4_9NOCA|nr:DUF3558 family protein [Rhodococcus rhodnii]EOM78258.1 hypothetical protein Rrhod_0343 [Rhodococcus rhodnii LMG 5362]TXG92315.1 DUF3558 domain-containing protein [Rhodococcus rhodnii]